MKKQICYLFVFCLLLSFFAGCTKQPATPTPADATPLEPQITQTADTVIQQEQPTQENQQSAENADKQVGQENQPAQNVVEKEQPADDKVQLSPKEQPTENKVQNEKKEPVQSVVEQPEEEPVEKENEPSVSGGTPALPLTFNSGDILGEFKNWIQTVPLMPEDIVPGSDEYYYYLKPELQEMLIDDRYYLLPNTPDGYTLNAIRVYARNISVSYKDEDGYSIVFSYRTDREQLPNTISSSKQQFVKYGDVQYLQEYAGLLDGSTSLTLQRNFDKYTIRINCEQVDITGITPQEVANLFTFTKVELPPLKEVMK